MLLVINRKTNKIWKFVEVHSVRTAFVEVLFIGTDFVMSIILSHITTESPIILPIYLPFLQLFVAGF